MIDGLAEADAGIKHDPLARHARGERHVHPFGEERAHVIDDVVVVRVVLHRPRLTTHVHETHVAPAVGHERRHVGVAQSGDVVDERRARVERRLGHDGLHRVHGHARPGRRESLHDRHDAAAFLLGGHHGSARARRLPADVQDAGAVGSQLQAVRDRRGRV